MIMSDDDLQLRLEVSGRYGWGKSPHDLWILHCNDIRTWQPCKPMSLLLLFASLFLFVPAHDLQVLALQVQPPVPEAPQFAQHFHALGEVCVCPRELHAHQSEGEDRTQLGAVAEHLVKVRFAMCFAGCGDFGVQVPLAICALVPGVPSSGGNYCASDDSLGSPLW